MSDDEKTTLELSEIMRLFRAVASRDERIASLLSALEEAERALTPFANAHQKLPMKFLDEHRIAGEEFTWGDCRRAISALARIAKLRGG